jgi:hypothetical protein
MQPQLMLRLSHEEVEVEIVVEIGAWKDMLWEDSYLNSVETDRQSTDIDENESASSR